MKFEIEFPLRKTASIFLLFFCALFFAQQHQFWLTDIKTNDRKKVADSAAAANFLDSLSQHNFYLTKLEKVETDSVKTEIFYDRGPNFNNAHVKLDENLAKEIKSEQNFYTNDLDSLKKEINRHFVNQGFTFSRVNSKFLGMKNQIPSVEISVIKTERRKIDGFVFRGYEKIPKRFVRNLEKEFAGKSYDEKNISLINQSLQNHPFIILERPPQTQFTKDSTHIYLFAQKKKSNTFDGIIGFGNDKNEKFSFNGTLNVNFRNMFNGFENISLYWQRNPDRAQTFDLKADIPYLFNSNIGTNINVNIFRQDSTFATVRFIPALYYNIGSRQKFGLRATLESSSVTDSLYTQGKDFTKNGIGAWYEYSEPSEIALFLYKTRIYAEVDLLKAKYGQLGVSSSQMRYVASAERNFHLRGNHFLNAKAETALLSSNEELTANEVFRFGGWNSLRGFNEDSLTGDFYFLSGLEYRYLIGETAFFDTFLQYAQLNNHILSVNPKLYSFGVGFNFILPIGLMSFQISNGNEFGNQIKFGDTKIHWGILTRF